MSSAASPLLSVQNLRVAFGDKVVVQSSSFTLGAGEKLALVGESGSGKSLSALALLRLVEGASISGNAYLFGTSGNPSKRDLLSISEREMRAVRGQEIAMIFQEPMTALNPLLSVGRQIAEVLQLKQGLPRSQADQQAVALLAETGIPEPERRAGAYPYQLSGGQRQRAMIAMALACNPRLLLADEPTTALDVSLRGQILQLLERLCRERGMALLLITHDLNLVRRCADRVLVMQQGQIVEQGSVSQVLTQPQHPYTQKLINSRPVRDVQEAAGTGVPALQAKGLRVNYPVALPGIRGWWRQGEFVAVQGADFSLPAGQTLGVVGESGSGKSSLALATLGLLPHGGQLRIEGQSWEGNSQHNNRANQRLRQRVQVVLQDPFAALSPRLTVEEIVGEGLRVHQPTLTALQRRARVRQTLAEVGLHEEQFPGLLARYPHAFSGGQRQRLAIARALIVQPQLLVLDEPTSALDVTIQQQVLQLLQRLQRDKALAYLLITHDVDVIRAMAHQVLVMKDGVIVEAGPVAQLLTHPRHPYTQNLLAAAAP